MDPFTVIEWLFVLAFAMVLLLVGAGFLAMTVETIKETLDRIKK